MRRRLLCFHGAAVAVFLALVACNYRRDTGFTRFIAFGDRFAATQLASVEKTHPFVYARSMGYDGQFYAQIATSPLLADAGLDAALDVPAYRARRIGLPWFAWLAGFGHAPWVLQAYALANVFAWLALSILLLHWIPPTNATALLAWAGCLFGVGAMMSVDRALTDLPSTLLITVAIFLAERGRRLGAGAAFAVALLTRETSALAGALLAPDGSKKPGAWLRAVVVGVAALMPLALWSLHVQQRFPDAPGPAPANFAAPFVAMFAAIEAIWRAVPTRGWLVFLAHLFSMVALSVQFFYLAAAARFAWRERWWRVGAPFALLMSVLGPLVWEDPAAAARALLPMTLAFNILLPRDRRWSFPLCLLGNLSLPYGVAYLLPPEWLHWS